MGRPVNPNVPEAGFVSAEQFRNTGSIAQSDFAVVADLDNTRKIVFSASGQSIGKTVTIATGANTGNITLTLPVASGTLAVQSSDFVYQTGAVDYWWSTSTTNPAVDAFVGQGVNDGFPFGLITQDVSSSDPSVSTKDIVFNTGSLTTAPNGSVGQSGSLYISTGHIVVPSGTAAGSSTGGVSIQTGKAISGGGGVGGIVIATGNTDAPVNSNIGIFSPSITFGPNLGGYDADNWAIGSNGKFEWLGSIGNPGGIDMGGSALNANGGISMGNTAITGMSDPSGAQDAATKAYVDGKFVDYSARAHASTTTISGSLATIVYSSEDFDASNSYNNSTGVYTAAVAGKYQVNASLLFAGTIALNNTVIMEIQKNSSVVSRRTAYLPAALTDGSIQISDIVSCSATDTIRIQVSTNSTSPSIVSSNFDNYLSIAKVF